MNMNRWLYCVASVGMMTAGGLAEQACSSSSSSSTPTNDAGSSGSGSGSGTVDSGVTAFGPGDGGPCSAPVGSYPDPRCDPSDETATYCTTPFDAGGQCALSPKCGDLSTCEPFAKNPKPGAGVQNFRMRLINITAPPKLATPTLQAAVVTNAVDLPNSGDGGASCGENGTGNFNWLISVDKAKGTVTTGGAPRSNDPFGAGYCYLNSTLQGTAIAPITVPATFTGNTFSTTPMAGVLNVPIFIPGGSVVLLPLNNTSLHDVTISPDGNCIGQINTFSISPPNCVDQFPSGQTSCSRWHSDGTLGGYITIAQADNVPIVTLGGESLCYLLSGQGNGATPQKCATGVKGDYCSTTGKACPGTGDSFWLSAQFAASAVNVTSGTDPLCAGNTSTDAGTSTDSGSSTDAGSSTDSGSATDATAG